MRDKPEAKCIVARWQGSKRPSCSEGRVLPVLAHRFADTFRNSVMLSGGPEVLRHCSQQFIPVVLVIVLKTINTKLISVWLLILSNLWSLTVITKH